MQASNIASIKLVADIADLQRKMDEARNSVASAMKDIEQAVNFAKKAMVLFAGVATLNGLKNMVSNAIEGAAALKDLQQQTGASVGALSAMAGVGKMSGTSLETIGSAMNKLTKNMATSTEESRGSAAAIRALGLDYAAFAGMAPDEQMHQVAKALAGFEDGASKSAVAMALFGKEGAQLLPFFADLAEQEELVGKLTQEQSEMADNYSDNLAKLQNSGKGWEKQLAMGLLPVLDETTKALLGVFNGTGGLREQMKKLTDDGTLASWGRGAVTALSYVVDGVQYVIRFLSLLGEYIGATAADAVQMFSGIGAAIKRVMSGDFSGAADEMRAIGQRTAAINADLATSINAQWDAKTMGQNLRERIAQIQSVGTVAAEAKKKLVFNDTGTPKDPKPKADRESEYDKLIAKIHEKMAAEQQELVVGKALTDGEKLALSVMVQLRDGKLKLTEAQAVGMAAALQDMLLSEKSTDAHKASAEALKLTTAEHLKYIDSLNSSAASIEAQVLKLQDENDAARLATSLGITHAQAIEQLTVARLRDAQAQAMSFGDDAAVLAIQREIDARKQLAGAMDKQATRQEAEKALADYLKQDVGTNLAAGFDKASQSMGVFVQGFSALITEQEKYNEARAAAASDTAKMAAVEMHHQQAQLNSYGSLAGAAKGFFKEGSKGYKSMQAAEKTFRAAELGLAIKNAAEKLGLISSVTAAKLAGDQMQSASAVASVAPEVAASMAKGQAAAVSGVANQAGGDPYTAFPRIAAMVAIMAALGFAVRGGGGGSAAPTNTGTGTVLGDGSAQSESISKSIDALRQVDQLTATYSAGMLASLRNIEGNIGGFAALLVRSGEIGAASVGVPTGFQQDAVGSAVGAISDVLTLGLLPGLGNLLGGLFGSKTSVTGQGLSANAQTLGGIQQRGFDASYYADIETKKKRFGITTSTRTSTQLMDAGAETERQLALILGGFADAVKSAGAPLGVNLGVLESRLDGFVVDIGRIDLQGLTGAQISERLTSVFGAVGDNIARAVLPGLEKFQAVGEGYFETVTRVASGFEAASQALDLLGISTIDYTQVVNSQGDIAAEVVRQSLVAAETTYDRVRADAAAQAAMAQSGGGIAGMMKAAIAMSQVMMETSQTSAIGKIIETLDGSAQDLADTYRALVDVRTSLQLLGMSGQAVSVALIQGAGGLDALTSGLATFEDKFFTAQEKVEAQSARMRKQFELLGVAMPQTNTQFKALVQGTNTSTEAGQKLLGGLLVLSGGFAELTDAIEAAKTADPASAVTGITASTDAFERLFLSASEQTALQTQRLAASFAALGVAMPKSNEQFRALVQGVDISTDAGKALLNGLLPLSDAFSQLTLSIKAAGQGVTDEIKRIRGLMDGGAAGQSYAALQASFAVQSAAARSGDQSALDALPAISKAMLDAAVQQARSSADLVRIQASTANSLQATLDAAMAAQAQATAPTIPGFASGGDHAGGLRIVGEHGPELEATGRARIFSAGQTAAMLGGAGGAGQGAVVAELQALRASNEALHAEVIALRADQQAQAAAIAGNTGKAARILERITPNGDAVATRVAEAL